jgi:Ni,Fe-hydrogenase III small subunit
MQPSIQASSANVSSHNASVNIQKIFTVAGATAEDGPLPELQLSQLSIDNEDDSLISSADPAACDFLLVALAFQEQQKSVRQSLELQLEDPVVTVAVGANSSNGQQQVDAGSCKAGVAEGKVAAVAAVAGCTATSEAK